MVGVPKTIKNVYFSDSHNPQVENYLLDCLMIQTVYFDHCAGIIHFPLNPLSPLGLETRGPDF